MRNANKYEEALGKAIKDAHETELDSIEFYKDMEPLDIDLNKYSGVKKNNYKKILAWAASFLLFVVFSGAFGILLSNESVSAAKFNIEKQVVKLQNQFSISKNENSKFIEDGSIVQEIKNLSDIDKGVSFFSELFITKNIPERFAFRSLTITKSSNKTYYAVYIFNDGEGKQLTISQQSIPEEGLSMTMIGITEETKFEEGSIYIAENPFGDGGNSGSYITEHYAIDVAGTISIKEIKLILQNK